MKYMPAQTGKCVTSIAGGMTSHAKVHCRILEFVHARSRKTPLVPPRNILGDDHTIWGMWSLKSGSPPCSSRIPWGKGHFRNQYGQNTVGLLHGG
jgi:hypothetical protein